MTLLSVPNLTLQATAFRSALKNKIRNRRLIFFHQPRCGGTSVNRVLRSCFGATRALTWKGIHQVDPASSRRAAEMLDRDIHALREGIVLYFAQVPDAKYVVGHIPYSTLLDEIPGEPWDYLTILRKPESRLISNYYYNASNPKREHYVIDVGLEEFLDSERGLSYGNSYVRCFLGECSPTDRRGAFDTAELRTPKAISTAKRNLDKFAIIGTIESLSSFEAALDQRYGTSIKFPHLNHNPAKKYPKMKDLPEHVRKKIEEVCAPDREVYEHALKNSPGGTG